MKKTVSIFVSTIGSGGAEKQAALLAKAISIKYRVLFIVLYGNYEQSKSVMSILKDSNAEVHLLTGSWFKRICKFYNLIQSNQTYCIFNYLTQCDFLGALLARLCRVTKIYNGIRNTDMERHKVILEYLSHNFIANGTIFNSHAGEKKFIEKGFKKNRCITIPNCYVDIAQPIERKDGEIVSIITVGRFVAQKDYETLIRSISELKDIRTDFILNIVGYGPLEIKIREWCMEYGVSDFVRFHINSDKIDKLLLNSDIYLSTSVFEGTSNSIMEAMNFSLPVVATDVGDNALLVSDGKSGFLHSVGEYKAIAVSLGRLVADSGLRNQMGRLSNMILRNNYSFEIFQSHYLKILKEA